MVSKRWRVLGIFMVVLSVISSSMAILFSAISAMCFIRQFSNKKKKE